jgi:MFS family permease
MTWGTPWQTAWNVVSLGVALLVALRVLRVPTEKFRRGPTSKWCWVFAAILFGASVGGLAIPVGAAIILVFPPWKQRRARRLDRLAAGDLLPQRYRENSAFGSPRSS